MSYSLIAYWIKFRVDYDDDDGPSSFAALNPTTPSYSHLADTLSSGLGSSNTTGSSSLSNSSSTITSVSASLLGPSSGSSGMVSNISSSAYSPYPNHPTPSPAMPLEFQCKLKK